MKKLLQMVWVLLMAPLLWVGCSDEDEELPTQRSRIESFLKSSHRPALVPYEELEEGSESSNYYTTAGNTVYRYIPNVNDPDRINRPEVTGHSRVEIVFRMYVFTYAAIPDSRLPEFTNDASLETAYIEAGLDTSHWSFGPWMLDMAKDDILKGLRLALVGCREGDTVEVYMTYNMAYGDVYFSVVPKQSPIYFNVSIEHVEQ